MSPNLATAPLSGQNIHRARRLVQTLALAFAVIVLNVVGDLSLAWGTRHTSEILGGNPLSYVRAMVNPFVAAGIAMLVLWLLTRMALMSWADLSFVLPVTSVGYVLAAILGHVFLHETVTPERWAGVFLIFAGAALVGATTHKTLPAEEAAE